MNRDLFQFFQAKFIKTQQKGKLEKPHFASLLGKAKIFLLHSYEFTFYKLF